MQITSSLLFTMACCFPCMFFKPGRITVANGSDHKIFVSVQCRKSHLKKIGAKLMTAELDFETEAMNVDSSGLSAVAPGVCAVFNPAKPCSNEIVYISIVSQPFADRIVPGKRTSLWENHPMVKCAGIVVSKKNEVWLTNPGEVWIDTNGDDHKRPEEITQINKFTIAVGGHHRVFVFVDSDEEYVKYLTAQFLKAIEEAQYDVQKVVYSNFYEFKQFPQGEEQEIRYRAQEGAKTAFISVFWQHDYSPKEPLGRVCDSLAIAVGTNQIVTFGNKLIEAKEGETWIDKNGFSRLRQPCPVYYKRDACTTVHNRSKNIIYAIVNCEPCFIATATHNFLIQITPKRGVSVQGTLFKEIRPGQSASWDRIMAGDGYHMYITIFYRNQNTNVHVSLTEICDRHRIDSDKSVSVDEENEANSRRGVTTVLYYAPLSKSDVTDVLCSTLKSGG